MSDEIAESTGKAGRTGTGTSTSRSSIGKDVLVARANLYSLRAGGGGRGGGQGGGDNDSSTSRGDDEEEEGGGGGDEHDRRRDSGVGSVAGSEGGDQSYQYKGTIVRKRTNIAIQEQYNVLGGDYATGGRFICRHCNAQEFNWKRWNSTKANHHLQVCESVPKELKQEIAGTRQAIKKQHIKREHSAAITEPPASATTSRNSMGSVKKHRPLPQPLTEVLQFSTADLYDTYLDKSRVVPCNVQGWKHYGGRRKFMGRAVTVKCFEDNSRLRQLAFSEPPAPEEPHVLVVDAGASARCAILGDMLAKTAKDNGWNGVVIAGCVRDVTILQTIPIGIYAMGSTPRKSIRRGEGQVGLPVCIDQALIYPNDIIFCDEDGILILDPEVYEPKQESNNNRLSI